MSSDLKAVFLSYASQDSEAAKKICDALRAAGVEVWFDADGGLEHGDEWDAKIRKQIKDCVLFIPIISATTQARHEGYFRIEWELAAERAMGIAGGVAFILPVIIDDTREPDALVPDRFRKVQWTRLPGGLLTPEVRQRFLKLWSHRVGLISHGQIRAAVAIESEPSRTAAAGRKSRRRYAIAAGAALAAVLLAGWWISRERSPQAELTPPGARATGEVKTTPPPPVGATDKSLLVLPLENLSPDPENAFFTEGMHAEIIATLQRLTDLKVIGRDTSLALKRGSASLGELARKVGVANVITGNVRRAGNKVRVQLELRRASDEALLWASPNAERELKDVFALQSEVADDVARVLQARETAGSNASARYLTKNPEAYDLFLKAGQAFFSGHREGFEQAIPLLNAALALDPEYASAVFMLAASHANLVDRAPEGGSAPVHAAEANRWASMADQLAPRTLGAEAMAIYYDAVERDYRRALEYADAAVQALPNDTGPHTFRAWALAELGRTGEAAESFAVATKIDPLNFFCLSNDVLVLSMLRRKDEAFAAMDRAMAGVAGKPAESVLPAVIARFRFSLTGQLPTSLAGMSAADTAKWLWRSRRFAELEKAATSQIAKQGLDAVTRFTWRLWQYDALVRLGRAGEARDGARELVELAERLQAGPDIGPSVKAGWLAHALVRAGKPVEALAAGNRYVEAAVPGLHVAERWRRQTELAEILAYLGRPRDCVDLLVKLLREPSGITVPMLRIDPRWDNVRNDPDFQALLADPKNSAPL